MNNLIFCILLVMTGLFVGIIAMIIVNYIKGSLASKKAEKTIYLPS